jgi:hypothetical protein
MDDDLEVLMNIDAKHLLRTGHRLFSCGSAEVIDKLLQPEKSILQELRPALVKDKASKLNRLEMVKLALLEEDTNVLQNGERTTGRCRGSLTKRLDNLCCTQHSLPRMCVNR